MDLIAMKLVQYTLFAKKFILILIMLSSISISILFRPLVYGKLILYIFSRYKKNLKKNLNIIYYLNEFFVTQTLLSSYDLNTI